MPESPSTLEHGFKIRLGLRAALGALGEVRLALAGPSGMRPLQAHCHLGLGTLYATIGQRQQAQAELTTAIDLYRAMDMTFWRPQAEAALAQIGEAEQPAGGVS